MKIIKCLLFFFAFLFFLSGCSTFKFGKNEALFTEEKKDPTNDIREFDLSYNYKVMGIKVNGKKSVIEKFYIHPDGKNIFIFISFPKIGILKSSDYGKSFKAQFFSLKGLDYYFNYIEEDEKEKNDTVKVERYFSRFISSKNSPEKMMITMGPYVFVTHDYGEKWFVKNIFFDDQKSGIIDAHVTDKDEVILVSENKTGYSTNFGKSWKVNYIKLNDINLMNIKYINGYYDNSTDLFFASIKSSAEEDYLLSRSSYDFFYNNLNPKLKSGLYYSKDFGKTWNKTGINIPLVMWKYKEKIYGSSVYPFSFYKKSLTDTFKQSSIYTTGKLNNDTTYKEEILKTMLLFKPDDYQIISPDNNKIVEIENAKDFSIIEEYNFNNIYAGLKSIENVPFIHWENGERKSSNNFYYEYNPYRFFKLWHGFKTCSPVLYTRSKDVFYRIRPDDGYINKFIRYSLENQIKLNSINPFLRRVTDIEFFDPALDPTSGFPLIIEYSDDFGKTWGKCYDPKHIRQIVDPLGTKRNAFYWLKNIEEKKNFKLRISFGFGDSPNLSIYPSDIMILNNDLLLILNYFSLNKNYQDGYLLPINK